MPDSRPYKCSVTQNTIYDAKVGVQFPGQPGGKMDLTVSRNYFAKTPAIVDGPGVVNPQRVVPRGSDHRDVPGEGYGSAEEVVAHGRRRGELRLLIGSGERGGCEQ